MSTCRSIATILLACLFMMLSACNSTVSTLATTTSYITYDAASGNCSQSTTNGGPAVANIQVASGNTITWTVTNGSSAALQVQFPATNPFYQYSSATASVTSGATHGVSGTTFPYQSISFTLSGANKSCANAGQLGIIMQ